MKLGKKKKENVHQEKKKRTPRELLIVDVLGIFIKIVSIILVFILMFTFMFGIHRNASASMYPAIQDGDLLIYYRLDKRYVTSDVLVMEYEDELLALRVIAKAGDQVDITEQGLVVNGYLQNEYKIYEKTTQFKEGTKFPLTVGEDEVFVLGDSREKSTDSRIFGTVKVSDTKGKVMAVIRRRGI